MSDKRKRSGEQRRDTAKQLASITRLCVAVSRHHHWVNPVIVGHDEQAIWTAAYTPRAALWGTTGRKVDPTGQRKDGQKIIDVRAVKAHVTAEISTHFNMGTGSCLRTGG